MNRINEFASNITQSSSSLAQNVVDVSFLNCMMLFYYAYYAQSSTTGLYACTRIIDEHQGLYTIWFVDVGLCVFRK